MIYTTRIVSRVTAVHNTTIYHVSVANRGEEIPTSILLFSFYHLEVKLNKKKKNTLNSHLKETSVFIHRKSVLKFFIVYSYKTSFCRKSLIF